MEKKKYRKPLACSIAVQNVLLSNVGGMSSEISGYKKAERSSFEDE